MTSYHETITDWLIIEGEEVSIKDCPYLPDYDPWIIETNPEYSDPWNWRGYYATWKIITGKLYLSKLSGKFEIKNNALVFAHWYSGEIRLKYIHEYDDSDAIGESYVIKNGYVISVEKPPYNWRDEVNEIRDYVLSRGITELLHFTRMSNLESIFEEGLQNREELEFPLEGSRSTKFNDQLRLDNADGAVCLSISFPNYKMFYHLQKKYVDEDWVIISLDPSLLWKAECIFCLTNAASNSVNTIPKKDRLGLKSLKLMFDDIPNVIKREDLNIPEKYTTDPQAEVLVGMVQNDYIKRIYFKDNETLDRCSVEWGSLNLNLNELIEIDKSLFTYRTDYMFWTKSISNNIHTALDD